MGALRPWSPWVPLCLNDIRMMASATSWFNQSEHSLDGSRPMREQPGYISTRWSLVKSTGLQQLGQRTRSLPVVQFSWKYPPNNTLSVLSPQLTRWTQYISLENPLLNSEQFQSVDLLGNENKISKERIGQLQARIGKRKGYGINDGYLGRKWFIQNNCPEAYQFLKVMCTL